MQMALIFIQCFSVTYKFLVKPQCPLYISTILSCYQEELSGGINKSPYGWLGINMYPDLCRSLMIVLSFYCVEPYWLR